MFHCNKCKTVNNLKLCSKCKNVRYCGIMCQREDWINHKQECTLINDHTLAPITDMQSFYDMIPDYLIKKIKDSICEEDRFTKAFIYSDMSQELEYTISITENKKEWSGLITESCISTLKNQPVCKRILVNKIDFLGNLVVLVCTCPKQCSKNTLVN